PSTNKGKNPKRKGGLYFQSCRWVLDHPHFQQWSRNEQGGVLHVVGDPGKGKTMLLCSIIDELERQLKVQATNAPATLLYFFCRADEDRLNNATSVLRGLLTCLFCDRSDLFDKYQRANEMKCFPLNVNDWDTLRSFFDEIVRDPALGELYVIVDALDECREELDALLELIRGLFNTRSRILVSSRNWHNILSHLNPSERHRSLSLELNADSVSAAVTAFIDWKVEWLSHRMKYDLRTKTSVSNHLHQNSTHTFPWVSLVCDVLGQSDVEPWEVPDLLKVLPPKLKSLYKSITEKMLRSRNAKLACSLLAVALTVKRPITLSEMRHLVEWPAAFSGDQRSLEGVLGYCYCLLTHRGSGVSLVHQSATDFLLDETEPIFWSIFPHGVQAENAAILSRSLAAMSCVLRKNIYNLQNMDKMASNWDVPIPDPLEPIWYPCEHWTHHLDTSTTLTQDAEAQEYQIYDFLTKNFLHWLEALSLRCESSIASSMISTLKALAATRQSRLRVLADDAWRFVCHHGDAIAWGPSQIYNSIILFSPENSAIHSHYKDASPSWLATKPQMESHWPQSLRTLEGHTKAVGCLAHSVDGSLLASGSADNTIRIWAPLTGVCLTVMRTESEPTSLTFSPDSSSLASAEASMITIWDVNNGQLRRKLALPSFTPSAAMGPPLSVNFVTFSPNGRFLVSTCRLGEICVWD
ncbi:hypothetical protein F5X68DRAFT_121483, partial [Plectosphaerella plurivora]